jgi:hypothetical protein
LNTWGLLLHASHSDANVFCASTQWAHDMTSFSVDCLVISLEIYTLLFFVTFYYFVSSKLEKLFHTMSSCGRFTCLDHLADVVRIVLEYVPWVLWKCSFLFLFFLSLIIWKLGFFLKKFKHRGLLFHASHSRC